MVANRTIRIGGGGAWELDLIPPAVLLAEQGKLHYLCSDALAERTLGIAHQRKTDDPQKGYNPLLEERVGALWPPCAKNGVKLISSMGAANPDAAAIKVLEVLREMDEGSAKVAAILGDDVRDIIKELNPQIWETGQSLSELIEYLGSDLVSANAYLGSAPIVQALKKGADIVITGRCSDPALFLAPMIYEFGWEEDDWDLKGSGTVIGHLLECSVQCTGGYFADPPYKVVPRIGDIGFPIAIVEENGHGVVTKLEGTGGLVNPATCKEQLLYEVHDPANYITPDVVADFSNVMLKQIRKDMVRVSGGKGRQKPEMLKVTLGFWEDWIGEAQLGYAGPDAYEHAKFVVDEMIQPMLQDMKTKHEIGEVRIDYIGVNSLFGTAAPEPQAPPNEVRIRVAVRCKNREIGERIGMEMMNIGIFGPIGWGLATSAVTPTLGVYSTLIPREMVTPQVLLHHVLKEREL